MSLTIAAYGVWKNLSKDMRKPRVFRSVKNCCDPFCPHFPVVHWEISSRPLRVRLSPLTVITVQRSTITANRLTADLFLPVDPRYLTCPLIPVPRPVFRRSDFPRSPTPPIRRSADPFLLAWIRIPSNCPKGSARSFQPRGSGSGVRSIRPLSTILALRCFGWVIEPN